MSALTYIYMRTHKQATVMYMKERKILSKHKP